jgi:subtilisin family serine protease
MNLTIPSAVPRHLLLCLFFIPVALLGANERDAGRHFILRPARLLNEQEQADLSSRGLIIEKALTAGRYLVLLTPGATLADDDPRIQSMTELSVAQKLDRSALAEAASGRATARLDVWFHEDVSFEAAKSAIELAGGSLVEPLQLDFHAPRRISIRITPSAVEALASDDRVMLVYKTRRLTPVADNADSAAESNVTPLYSAPYGLSGQGVALSYFELAQVDASHPEFQGRLTTHGPFAGTSSDDVNHATHTAGTMIAAGLTARAKGMAPAATLHAFDALSDNWLDLKQSLPTYSPVADNNSWGYILGWCNTGKCTGWVWEEGTELFYGGYSSQETAQIDKFARSTGVLMVHSAGNDAGKTGPQSVPFQHSHFDDNGKIVSGYCYSTDGSGNDCPVPPACKAGSDASGVKFCETVRHPQITEVLPPPWVSIGTTAVAKNIIAVGAVTLSRQIASYSSRGPTRDGRVKPDLVARGGFCGSDCVFSTLPNNSYGVLSGTSMAAPVVTGTAALLVEQWRRTFGGQNPTSAILKTLMIATADDLGNPGPDFTYGFGLLNAKAAVDNILADGGQGRRIVTNSVGTGDRIEIPISLSAAQNLRVVLGWLDPEVLIFPVDSGDPTDPLAAATLVNDLDLKVVDAGGNDVLPYVLNMTKPDDPATRGVNHIDNTEEVEISNAPAGVYKIVVTGKSVTASSPQAFVVVANADLGATALPCTEPFGPTNTPESAYGNLVSTQTITSRTCDANDVDFFKFAVDKAGPVSVRVAATDTPVRATLTSNATAPVTVDVAAGTTQTVTTTYSGTTSTIFFVKVEPIGAIGLSSRYSITPTFSYAQHGRRRSVRRAH